MLERLYSRLHDVLHDFLSEWLGWHDFSETFAHVLILGSVIAFIGAVCVAFWYVVQELRVPRR